MNSVLKDKLPLLLVLLLSVLSLLPLLPSGFFIMHDFQHVARLHQLDKALFSGQFPVRWVADLGFGYGYALFNFYPPLSYYVGEIARLTLGTGFVDSIKIVWAIALVGSALSMYFLAKEFFGKIGGVVSALFYLYAPYHAVDAYIRGALAELFSFAWLPLILLFSYKSIKEESWKYTLWTGVTLALLMITHNLIFLPFSGLFALWYLIILLIYGRKNFALQIAHCTLLISVAFGLSAFFWAPALLEKQYTLADQLLTRSLASYKIHFVCAQQLWNSDWGFGGSIAGCVDGLSFKIGKLHILLSLASLPTALILWSKRQKLLLGVLLTSHFSLLISVFMTTSLSQTIWDNIPPLWYLQFPWRFLEFVVLFSSLLAGSAVLLLKNLTVKLAVATILICTLLFTNLKLFIPQKYLPEATDENLLTSEQIRWGVSSTSFEYMPKSIKTKTTSLGTIWVDIEKDQIAQKHYVLKSGDFSENESNFTPNNFLLKGSSKEGAEVIFSITDFPGWKIALDNSATIFRTDNMYKLITVTIPPGEHEVRGYFRNTTVRTLGNFASGLTLALILVFSYAARRIKK